MAGILLVHYDSSTFGVQSLGPRLAVQLYDSIFMAVIGIWLWVLAYRRQFRTRHFHEVASSVVFFLLVFGIFRFLEDFMRDPLSRSDAPLMGLFFSQWAALCLSFIGLIVGVIWVIQKSGAKS